MRHEVQAALVNHAALLSRFCSAPTLLQEGNRGGHTTEGRRRCPVRDHGCGTSQGNSYGPTRLTIFGRCARRELLITKAGSSCVRNLSAKYTLTNWFMHSFLYRISSISPVAVHAESNARFDAGPRPSEAQELSPRRPGAAAPRRTTRYGSRSHGVRLDRATVAACARPLPFWPAPCPCNVLTVVSLTKRFSNKS